MNGTRRGCNQKAQLRVFNTGMLFNIVDASENISVSP